ncbi:MAG: hypothetical protein K0R65_3064, partial [Crocinitomicaceae bacterium]|nr:hypothetical protein [Crocinitomicaceae bacterium]
EMKVSLFDLNGTEVGKYTLTSYQNEINLKELKAGIYILKSESVLGIYSGKLVVF